MSDNPRNDGRLRGYAQVLAGFSTAAAAAALAGRIRGQNLPDRFDVRDLALGDAHASVRTRKSPAASASIETTTEARM